MVHVLRDEDGHCDHLMALVYAEIEVSPAASPVSLALTLVKHVQLALSLKAVSVPLQMPNQWKRHCSHRWTER